MLRKLLSTLALLAGSVFTAHAAPTITLTPSLTNLTVGNTVTLDVNIQGVVDLFGWQFDVSFALAGILDAIDQTDGGFLSPGQTYGDGVVDSGTGTITGIYSSFSGGSGVTGDGILASITFQAISLGAATISVANVMLLDSNLGDIFFDFGDARSATVNVTDGGGGNDVPEPSGIALAGLALALALRSRQRTLALPVA